MALKNLSFVERRSVLLDANEAEKVKLAAKRLLACEPQLSDMRYFEKATGCGLSETGHILIGDTSQIAAPKRFSDFFLEYRLSLLAGEDDLVLIARGRYTDYESYVGKILENSETSFIAIGGDDYPGKQASPVICLNDRDSFGLLVEYASGQHELTLVPHMATGAVWSLARKLGLKLGTKVLVAGPPPRLSARVNDKVWFASTLKKLMGDFSVPEEVTAFGLAGLTNHVRRLSGHNQRLVIKIPNSAGSRGNFYIESRMIAGKKSRSLSEYLVEKITNAGWDLSFPMQVQAWEDDVITSPSVQIWIPHTNQGPPIIEGIFEQKTVGVAGEFVGAVQAVLPDDIDEKIARESSQIAALFQQLGYFGRCSFDCVVTGKEMGSAQICWIECNGRWGGVSVPMSFMNRTECAQACYIVCQQGNLNFPPRKFQSVLKISERHLWWPGKRQGIVISSPVRITRGNGADFIAIGDTFNEADSLARDFLDALCSAG